MIANIIMHIMQIAEMEKNFFNKNKPIWVFWVILFLFFILGFNFQAMFFALV